MDGDGAGVAASVADRVDVGSGNGDRRAGRELALGDGDYETPVEFHFKYHKVLPMYPASS